MGLGGENQWCASFKGGILCDWLRMHIWLSLIGPKLGAGTKIREAVSY